MGQESPEEHRRRLLAMADAAEEKAGRRRKRGGGRPAGENKGGTAGSLRPCRECGDPVARTAKSCPHCGASSPFPITPDEQRKSVKGCLLLMGAATVLYLVQVLWDVGSGGWRQRDNSIAAYNRATQYVTAQLRSPSSADYPSVFTRQGRHTTPLGQQRYRIRSYVEAQNAFGAVVRTNFDVVVKQTGADAWTLESLVLDP